MKAWSQLMRMTEIRIETSSRAAASDVFRLLRDGATWPRWSLFDGYRADVDLLASPDGGTTIRWCSTFHPRHRALGWFWRWFMQRTLREVGQQLARAAEDPGLVALAKA